MAWGGMKILMVEHIVISFYVQKHVPSAANYVLLALRSMVGCELQASLLGCWVQVHPYW